MDNANHSRDSRSNGVGPWGKMPLSIVTAPISDRAVRLAAYYAATDINGDGKVHPSFAETDKALGWGMDKTKRARRELVEIEAISVKSRSSRDGRLPDEVTLLFTQQRGTHALLRKRAPMPYVLPDKSIELTDKSLEQEGTHALLAKQPRRRLRKLEKHLSEKHPSPKAVGVTDNQQEGTGAPLGHLFFQRCEDDELGHSYSRRCRQCVTREGRR